MSASQLALLQEQEALTRLRAAQIELAQKDLDRNAAVTFKFGYIDHYVEHTDDDDEDNAKWELIEDADAFVWHGVFNRWTTKRYFQTSNKLLREDGSHATVEDILKRVLRDAGGYIAGGTKLENVKGLLSVSGKEGDPYPVTHMSLDFPLSLIHRDSLTNPKQEFFLDLKHPRIFIREEWVRPEKQGDANKRQKTQ
jgi:hypothetical protein